jgi:hypothetical protein
MRTHKWCPACQRDLPWGSFGQDLTQSIGIKGVCRECFNAKNRQRYAARSEDQKAARRARDRATWVRRKA